MKKKAIPKKGPQQLPQPPDLTKLFPTVKYQHLNAIGPRYQWESNDGYCGEVSLISAGLYYGQYLSQYDVRVMAWASQSATDRKKTQNEQQSIQVLLGDNDASVAQMLKLNAEVCEVQDSVAFLQWVKQNVVSGYPVIIGVFNNEYLIYTNDDPTAGDSQYDHIVPVIGWGSARPLDQADVTGDVLLVSDNGLYFNGDTTPVPPDNIAYYYFYPIPYFLADRALANTTTDPNRVYSLLSLPETPKSTNLDYAIAIKGVLDENNETLPVTITTNINYEAPFIVDDGSNTRPAPEAITLTITVSGLTVGQTYNVYCYNDEDDVPVSDFNANSGDAWQVIVATAATWTSTMNIQSSDKIFLRVVNENAG